MKFIFSNDCLKNAYIIGLVSIISKNIEFCSSFNLTVLHNNDFHTHFEPINEFSSECKSNELCYGGVARTVAKVLLIY